MADTRSLQRNINRIYQIETFIRGNLSQVSLQKIKAQIKLLSEEWDDYKNNEKSYKDVADNIALQEVIETKYFEVKGQLIEAELTLEKPEHQTDLDTSLQELVTNQRTFLHEISSLNNRTDTDVRLPRVNVPFFSGIYSEFASFRDLFEASINSNAKISKVHKLQYLKGLLKGEAAALVRHIAITDANYDEAWEIINNRYDKKKHVTSMLLKQFMEQPAITQASSKALHHMRDVSDEVLRGLKVLGEQAESRDPWIIHILVNKLDQITKHAWAQHSFGIEFPTIKIFFEFLNKQSDTLETCEPTKRIVSRQPANASLKVLHVDAQTARCFKCGEPHYLRNCEEFLKLSVHERRGFVAENKLCFLCLFKTHQSQNCRSRYRCGLCRSKHHTTLHQDKTAALVTTLNSQNTNAMKLEETTEALNVAHAMTSKRFTALLPTAIIRVRDANSKFQRCRVLLDSGAQASFISESCAQRLALPRRHANILIKGVTPGTESTRGTMSIHAVSLYSTTESIYIDVLILNKLTNLLPSHAIDTSNLSKLKDLQLADPNFDTPGPVDIIIGADHFFGVLKEGRLDKFENNMFVQNSMFGWIISGKANESSNSIKYSFHVCLNIDDTLKRFWEMEEITAPNPFTEEEEECEKHFKRYLAQNYSGKYVVKLPFKTSPITLGNSLSTANKRFLNLERKLSREPELKKEYIKSMREYLNMGHMVEISPEHINNKDEKAHYYLPHHSVTKIESTTMKLRVVFDGSSKTTNGNSINEMLMVGPTIQPTLWITLLKFRYNRISITADIEKMYRQVNVAEEDQEFQRVIWREDTNEPIKHYKLSTVTFGMSSSAFLAIRSLHQVAFDFESEYPNIAEEILTKFYIDDYLSGAETIDKAKHLKETLSDLLSLRGFKLRKWRSNVAELAESRIDCDSTLFSFEEAESTIKILGLQWDSKNGIFSFKVSLPDEIIATKRTLISNASRVFDPLGLLAPSMIIAKILFQKLWMKKLDWDDELPDDIAMVWNQLKAELPLFKNVKVKRFVNTDAMQIHGFCDASERAYAAAIYGRFQDEQGNICTALIASKTKVAPIRQISLPRLELCGAHLLAKLIKEVKKTMSEDVPVYGWTDSTIVLAWLSDHPTKWKTFVANRVSVIQELVPRNQWNHIRSENNPADCASRGVLPSKLISLHQWWHGPKWLSDPEQLWPVSTQRVFFDDTICEMKKNSSIPLFHMKISIEEGEIFQIILNKTFSFSKAIRILAYVFRFINNARQKKIDRQNNRLSLREIENATVMFIKWVQHLEFANEIHILTQNMQLPNKNKLSSLTPFLDSNSLLRVGGRLQHADTSYDSKHPIILPKSHVLSRMIISYFHIKYLHPGPSHTSHLIRQKFWIINGRSIVRNEIRKCIPCFKYRAKTAKQLMGDLPSVRITQAKPFSKCGIDYAGPILLASKKGRGAKLIKGYIAIFICMVTKALHIEAVTELTTDAFIAALKRFSARRNVPSDIYTDNGTNFVGANRMLAEVYRFHNIKLTQSIISEFCTSNQINWHFTPPSAPHFGGLWEAAVKSVKGHLTKVTGNCHLTYEEMSTLLCQIEAILNSRPLCPISEDDVSFEALTPGHFLIGSSLESVPAHDVEQLPISRLSRWQQVEQRAQCFWKRFHKDYLNNLQQRGKWKNRETNILTGDLVLIKEDNVPSCKWLMGRVVAQHPDEKGLTRVVTVKTATSMLKRPIVKIVKLPLD